ncbi:MAG: glycosyltransferase family 2 protein [Flavobacteriales bacterium]|nr:glycosyltransferase family 2 protein [Flavobacteriales bacterium]
MSLVSVIIPAYNAEKYLERTVQSVLDQTYPHLEIIVIDDGSTDSTKNLFEGFELQGVKCISQENKGASAARNNGIRIAQGEYIQFLDADDLIHPDKITEQVELMKNRESDLSFTFWGEFSDSLDDLKPFKYEHKDFFENIETGLDIMRSFGMNNWIVLVHAWLVRKDLIQLAGEWNESISNNDDGEFFSRVLFHAKHISILRSQMAYYRKEGGESLSILNSEKKIISAIKSWDLIHELVLKTNDMSLLAYPKKGYYANYVMTKHPFPEFAKKFGKKFDDLKVPFFLTEWEHYWIVQYFGIYRGGKVFKYLIKFRLIKSKRYPI